jgi:hypothetical protein
MDDVERPVADLEPTGEIDTTESLAGARVLVRFLSVNVGGDEASALYDVLQLKNLHIRFTGSKPVPAEQGFREIRRASPAYLLCLDKVR